jgi:hypothetical protein
VFVTTWFAVININLLSSSETSRLDTKKVSNQTTALLCVKDAQYLLGGHFVLAILV